MLRDFLDLASPVVELQKFWGENVPECLGPGLGSGLGSKDTDCVLSPSLIPNNHASDWSNDICVILIVIVIDMLINLSCSVSAT